MTEIEPVATSSTTEETLTSPEIENKEGKGGTIAIVVAVVIILAIIAGVVVLSLQEGEVVSQVRDIFIILMALMMFIIGVALVVLIIQLADLTNLLKNEVTPIMSSTKDTVNTLKGTVRFLSDNLAEPVIKINESLAGAKKIAQLLRFKK